MTTLGVIGLIAGGVLFFFVGCWLSDLKTLREPLAIVSIIGYLISVWFSFWYAETSLDFILSGVMHLWGWIYLFKYRCSHGMTPKFIVRRRIKSKINKGKFDFPCELFFNVCQENGVSSFNQKTDLAKGKIIARKILDDQDVPREYQESLLTKEYLTEMLSRAVELIEEKEKQDFNNKQKEAEQRKIDSKIPQTTNWSNVTLKEIQFLEDLKNCSPIEKREKYLKKVIQDKKEERKKYKAQANQPDLFESVLNSAHIEKEHDIYVAGGIATGIGGIGAGIVAASQAAADNERIRAQNAENKKAAADLAYKVLEAERSGVYFNDPVKKARSIVSECNRIIQYCQSELQEAKNKMVIDDIPVNELFEALEFCARIKHGKCYESVIFTVKNLYTCDLPKNMVFSLDGTIQVKVYCDDIFVDEVCCPFPSHGIRYNSSFQGKFPLKKYMIDGETRNYRFEYAPNRLWLIEV